MDPPPTEKAYSPPGSHVSFLSSPKGISIFIMTVGPMEHLKCASITGASCKGRLKLDCKSMAASLTDNRLDRHADETSDVPVPPMHGHGRPSRSSAGGSKLSDTLTLLLNVTMYVHTYDKTLDLPARQWHIRNLPLGQPGFTSSCQENLDHPAWCRTRCTKFGIQELPCSSSPPLGEELWTKQLWFHVFGPPSIAHVELCSGKIPFCLNQYHLLASRKATSESN
ncbi:hypothetical protein PSHT_13699 [Puccinia striiformis]|uniref:Uncharacterized protein n=1 Tax=Puccinia striiformis TaxID=27350 RepID=A0A2S4UPB6_9BASI|nr:hypothetical protein PSHT_13699 [Puccinia striiformis]